MTYQFLIAFGLVTMLAVIACGSTSVAPRTAASTQTTPSTVATPTDARAPATASTATTTTLQRRDSWEQPLWTNPESESDTMLVTLVSSQGQLEEGESTVITASAINMSDAPLEVNLIIRLGAGLLVSSTAGCTGNPCSTGRDTVAPGQQASSSVHVTLESGAVRDRYELVLN